MAEVSHVETEGSVVVFLVPLNFPSDTTITLYFRDYFYTDDLFSLYFANSFPFVEHVFLLFLFVDFRVL